MRFDISLLTDQRIAVVSIAGPIALEGVSAMAAALTAQPDYEPDWGTLIDLRFADLSELSSEDLRAVVSRVASMRGNTPHKRGVVIGDDEAAAGIVALLKARLNIAGVNHATRLFANREDCLHWLSQPLGDETG